MMFQPGYNAVLFTVHNPKLVGVLVIINVVVFAVVAVIAMTRQVFLGDFAALTVPSIYFRYVRPTVCIASAYPSLSRRKGTIALSGGFGAICEPVVPGTSITIHNLRALRKQSLWQWIVL